MSACISLSLWEKEMHPWNISLFLYLCVCACVLQMAMENLHRRGLQYIPDRQRRVQKCIWDSDLEFLKLDFLFNLCWTKKFSYFFDLYRRGFWLTDKSNRNSIILLDILDIVLFSIKVFFTIHSEIFEFFGILFFISLHFAENDKFLLIDQYLFDTLSVSCLIPMYGNRFFKKSKNKKEN